MIKIMADSTCHLNEDIVKKYDIGIVPLSINMDGEEYLEMGEFTPEDFFKIIDNIEENPTTSMPSPGAYLKVFKEAVEEGHKEILCICMSDRSSGSYQSGALAKKYFYEENPNSSVKIHVLNSKSMSHGSGYLVLKSALLREKGLNFQELIDFNETYKRKVKHLLSVDDLDNIIRSGRLSNSAAFIGKILNIKPIMTVDADGQGITATKVRSFKRILSYYIKEFKARVDNDLTDFIIIGYSSDKQKAEILKEKIYNETDFTGDIYMMQMGLTVCHHAGKGALSMFFIEK